MEHAPIYRSNTHLRPASSFRWRRTASLASAVAGIAVGGIALGYHGFAYANDTLKAATSISQSGSLQLPAFTVQTTSGGHPDAISVLSAALAQIQASPALVQAVGTLPSPFPAEPQPPVVAASPTSEADSAFIGPPVLTFQLVPDSNANAGADAVPAPADDLATAVVDDPQPPSLEVAQVDSPASVRLAAPVAVFASDVAGTDDPVGGDAQIADDDQTAADAPQSDDGAPAPGDTTAPSEAPTAAPRPASTAKSVRANAPAPQRTPDPAPVAEPKAAPRADPVPALERPVVVRRPTPPDPPVEVHSAPPPPKVDENRGNDNKPNNNNGGGKSGGGDDNNNKGKGGGKHG